MQRPNESGRVFYQVQEMALGVAAEMLGELGATSEIARVLMGHSSAYAPSPGFRRDEIKGRLAALGWMPQMRVGGHRLQRAKRPHEDRYDLVKAFNVHDTTVGVAIELDKGQLWPDVLRIRRGIRAGQLLGGVLVFESPSRMKQTLGEVRLTEPLLGELPVKLMAPAGPGLGYR